MSQIQVNDATERAQQLASLFERRMITEASLVSGIAELVTPENISGVLMDLPPTIRNLVRDWAKSLPEDDCNGVVFWPLDRNVRVSFKEWLHGQEKHENGI